MASAIGCEHGYIKPGDSRGVIMCKLTNNICPHVRYCQLRCRYEQSRAWEQCPIKEGK